MPVQPELLLNYEGPLIDSILAADDKPGLRIGPQDRELPGGRRVPRYTPRPNTLADELRRLSEDIDSEDDEYETDAQREARVLLEESLARREKILKNNKIRDVEVPREPTPPPVSKAQQRFPPPKEPPFSMSQIEDIKIPKSRQGQTRHAREIYPVRDARTSSQTLLWGDDEPREILVKPPKLSSSITATISREYGWRWLWWIIIPPILLYLAIAVNRGYKGGEHIPISLENTFNHRTETKKAEKANSKAVVDICSAIEDVAMLVVDEEKTLIALDDSPLSQAVLPIQEFRQDIMDERGQPVVWILDKFVSRSREVDHAWRSFLQQQGEAIAELTGLFDGYFKSADHDWMKAAHNITLEDFSDIPLKTHREGELLLCEILGNSAGTNCPVGLALKEIHNDLLKEIGKSRNIPAKTFDGYKTSKASLAKFIKTTLRRWERALGKIEAAKVQYKSDVEIGEVNMVVKKLRTTAETLERVMRNNFFHRLSSPEFPNAIKRLAAAKVLVAPPKGD